MRKADIGHYVINENEFDLIVAVSTLEHVESDEVFEYVLKQMAVGTKNDGINCLIVNSEIEEIELATNKKLDAMMEINKKTEDMIHTLNRIYRGWEMLSQVVKPLEYTIVRDEKVVLLKINAVTFIVRKPAIK